MKVRLSAVGLGLAALLGACSNAPTGPPAGAERDSLEFSAVAVDTGRQIFDPIPVRVRGTEGAIVVDGFVVARCDTWAIRAGLARDSDGYRLRIFYRVLADPCEHAVRHAYHARIVGVPAGVHHVRVRQPVLSASAGFVVATVLEASVTVAPPANAARVDRSGETLWRRQRVLEPGREFCIAGLDRRPEPGSVPDEGRCLPVERTLVGPEMEL